MGCPHKWWMTGRLPEMGLGAVQLLWLVPSSALRGRLLNRQPHFTPSSGEATHKVPPCAILGVGMRVMLVGQMLPLANTCGTRRCSAAAQGGSASMIPGGTHCFKSSYLVFSLFIYVCVSIQIIFNGGILVDL